LKQIPTTGDSSTMATIVERKKKGGTYYQVRIRLKGHPQISETFEHKIDAKA
jgi:hypothetical protein